MSKELDILISDREVQIGDTTIVISKPRWSEIKDFIAIVEKFFEPYFNEEDDVTFIKKMLAEGGEEIRISVEKILEMCLRKNNFSDSFKNFVDNLEYDFVVSILFQVIEMNLNFFREGMKKVGIKAEAEVKPKTS